MNKLKKLTCLLLALVMVFAMAVTASAATITAPSGSSRTYEVYQIFVGDLDEMTGILSNVKWGQNGTGTKDEPVDETILKALADVNSKSDAEKWAVIKQYVDLTSAKFGEVKDGSPLTAPNGYYLIKDVGAVDASQGEAYGRYVVKIVKDTTIEPKVSNVSFQKKIKDTNDSTGVTSGWQDSADYDIGDSVPFQLKGTVAEDFAQYENAYYFAFHDEMEDSLTFEKSSVKVYVDGKEITTGFTVDGSEHAFDVVFENLKDIAGITGGCEITVEYTAKLNDSAVLGNQGNVNKARLEYSNNPYTNDTGKTNWDSVIVFTYQVVVNKYANDVKEGNEKTGAAFKLEKKVGEDWVLVKEFQADENTSSFTFKGLDDGEYRLTETVTPSGFNTIDPIEFTVTAEHTVTWEGEDRNTILTSLNGNVTDGTITFTATVADGTLTTDVVNKSGAELPTTGGIGTTIFYVLGGVLVLAAVVLLVTKKRMHSEN